MGRQPSSHGDDGGIPCLGNCGGTVTSVVASIVAALRVVVPRVQYEKRCMQLLQKRLVSRKPEIGRNEVELRSLRQMGATTMACPRPSLPQPVVASKTARCGERRCRDLHSHGVDCIAVCVSALPRPPRSVPISLRWWRVGRVLLCGLARRNSACPPRVAWQVRELEEKQRAVRAELSEDQKAMDTLLSQARVPPL